MGDGSSIWLVVFFGVFFLEDFDVIVDFCMDSFVLIEDIVIWFVRVEMWLILIFLCFDGVNGVFVGGVFEGSLLLCWFEVEGVVLGWIKLIGVDVW